MKKAGFSYTKFKKISEMTSTWYGWLSISAVLAGIVALMGVLGIDYSAMIFVTVLTAIAGLISFSKLDGNSVKQKKSKSKRAILKTLLSDLAKVILFIVSGLLIGGVSISATVAGYERQYAVKDQQKEVVSQVGNTEPTSTLQKAARLYQYMYCSNGTYRYYTDEEFDKQNTGFTESGPDYCAQNGQGKKVQLADVPPAAKQTNSPTTYDFPTSAWPSAPTVQPYPSLSDEPAIVPAVCDEALEVSYINAFDRDSMNLLRQWANDPYKSNYSVAQSYKNKLATLTNSTNEKLADINCSTRVRAPAVNY